MSYGIQVFNSEGGMNLNTEYPLCRYVSGLVLKNSNSEINVPTSVARIGLLAAIDVLPNGQLAAPRHKNEYPSGKLELLRSRWNLGGLSTVFQTNGMAGVNGAMFLSSAPPDMSTQEDFGLNIFNADGGAVFNSGSNLAGVVHSAVVDVVFRLDVTRTIEIGTFPNTLVCMGLLPEEINVVWEQGGWKNYRAAGCGIKRIGDTYYMVSRLEDDYPTPRGPTQYTLQVPILFLRKPRNL